MADTASAACPAQPGSCEMISIILAAVICDADEPCSVNAAYEPESSFTMSPRSTTRHFYFLCFFSNSAFFKWQMSINDAKCTFKSLRLASSITSDLFLTFARFHAEVFQFYPVFVHRFFRCRYFHRLRHRNKCVYQIFNDAMSCHLSLQYGLHEFLAQVLPYAVYRFHLL